MWGLTQQERIVLAGLGIVALAGLGLLAWQQRRPPLMVAGAPAPAEAARWDQALEAARRVDVNTAGVAELERLPQVGPALARRIVEDREARGPFGSAEDLSRVRGIGPRTVANLKERLATE